MLFAAPHIAEPTAKKISPSSRMRLKSSENVSKSSTPAYRETMRIVSITVLDILDGLTME